MHRELQLASERSESRKLVTSSVNPSAVMAATMLDFVREMSLGTENFTQRQSDYWIWVLQAYEPRLIQQAFHKWVKKSKHMPVPSEILEMLDAMVEAERQAFAAKETQRYLDELRATRECLAAEGLPQGPEQLHGILQQAAGMVKSFPSLPHPNRAWAAKQALARALQGKEKKPSAKVDGSGHGKVTAGH